MLYHLDKYDVPLAGIGIYGKSIENGERVYFSQSSGGPVKCFDLASADEIIPTLEVPSQIKDEIRQFITDLPGMSDENFSYRSLDGYDIECSEKELYLSECYKYDIYRIPSEIMTKIDYCHKLFQENVGYHTDHDPEIRNKVSTATPQTREEYFANMRTEHPNIREMPKEYIGTVKVEDIIWFK